MKQSTPSFRRHLGPSAALALSLLALSSIASSVYPIKFGQIDDVFGKVPKEVEYVFSHPAKRQFAPFTEENASIKAPDRCFGAGCYDANTFNLLFYVQGDRRESIADCGGSFSIYLRPGMENTPTSGAPVMLVYTMEKFPARLPSKPMFVPVNNENSTIRTDPIRFSSEMPTYGNSHVRVPAADPKVHFQPMEKGWCVRFSFRWLDFQDRLPFAEGQYPVSWRLIVKRTRADGSVATWGSLAEPVLLNWGRPGDAIVDDIPLNYFLHNNVGPAYAGAAGFLRGFWTTSRTEKWMLYLDPGIPTFEPKNPESDDLFVKSQVEPILDSNANIEKAIYFNGKQQIYEPPIKSYAKAERRAILAGLDRILYVTERIDDARRDYLLARLLDKPVPVRTMPKAAQPKKLKKIDRNRDFSADDLGLEDTGDGDLIELDDIDF